MSHPIERHMTDFLEYLEIERGRAPRTIQNYDFYLRRFARWAGLSSPSDITEDVVHTYRLWLNRTLVERHGNPLKKSTQNYHLIALRAFLKFLSKRDIKSLAPEKIELAKQPMRAVAFLETDELKRLLAAPLSLGDTVTHLRDTALLDLFFSTG